jgi:hypothetical protein
MAACSGNGYATCGKRAAFLKDKPDNRVSERLLSERQQLFNYSFVSFQTHTLESR